MPLHTPSSFSRNAHMSVSLAEEGIFEQEGWSDIRYIFLFSSKILKIPIFSCYFRKTFNFS